MINVIAKLNIMLKINNLSQFIKRKLLCFITYQKFLELNHVKSKCLLPPNIFVNIARKRLLKLTYFCNREQQLYPESNSLEVWTENFLSLKKQCYLINNLPLIIFMTFILYRFPKIFRNFHILDCLLYFKGFNGYILKLHGSIKFRLQNKTAQISSTSY